MASEVEMDKSAVGVKTLMEKSCNSSRDKRVIYHCSATFAVQDCLTSACL